MSALELAFTQEYQRSLVRLDHKQQAHVNVAVLKLQKGANSSDLHKLTGVPFFAFGVNQGAFRVICQRSDDLLVLLHVAPHDAAYQWASRHRVVQIGRFVRLLRTSTEDDPADQGHEDQITPLGPLATQPDKVFRHFHLGPGVAQVLRTIPDEHVLIETLEHFREPLASALLGLATDPEALGHHVRQFEAALKALEAAAEAPPAPSLKEAIVEVVNAGGFWMAPTDGDQLAEVLRHPLDAWRIFLHPSQMRLVSLDTDGAYKITGGPGTGKTVVALHRARHLLAHTFADDPRPLLLTTFSRVLAKELERGMALLCVDAPHLLGRVEVKTITRVAQDILGASGAPSTFLDDDAVDACWQKAMKFEGLGRNEGFYRAEREHVVARNGAWTEALYLRTPRQGRRSRIDRLARRKVWKVLEAFEEALSSRHGGDGASLAREATLRVTGAASTPYCAVVCDELQDVSASDLRLLAALTRDRDSGKVRPNSLLLVGDNHQSLYRSPIVLSRCGLDVRGHASVLRRNYRTTEGIRRAAIDVIKGVQFDEDEDEGELDVLEHYTSTRSGPRPERRVFASAEQEADWIVEQSRAEAGFPLLILTRTNAWLDALAGLLRTRGVSPKLLAQHESLTDDDRVVLCSLHRSKGLEAPRVIIAGRHLIPRPWDGKGDAGDKLIWERQERCLLYVGMTRARDWCALSSLEK